MRKKRSEIVSIAKQEISQNLKSYIIITIIFLIGIFLGTLFVNQINSKEEISKYITTYIDETKSIEKIDYFTELQKDIKENILLVILLWFAGTTIIGIPIVLALIIFRGFCLGYTIASSVYVLGKIKGIIFVLITIFLQNLVFIPVIIILGVSSIKLYKSIIKDKRKENIKISIIKHSVLSLAMLALLILSSVIKIEISYRMIVNLIKYF